MALAIKRAHNFPPHLSCVSTLPDNAVITQQAQLSQMLHVIENLFKSLKITEGHSK